MVRRWMIPLAGLALAAGSAVASPVMAAGSALAAGPGTHAARAAVPRLPAPGGLAEAAIPCTVVGPSHDLCYSINWSGYVVSGGMFSTVTAAWTEAKVTCTKGDGTTDMSPWVGLDGYTTNTVEQIGTSGDCAGATPVYYAWWEFYPAGVNVIYKDVEPGDQFTATVTHSGASYTLTLHNTTRNWTRTVTKSVTAKNANAEAVLEKAAPHLSQWAGAQSFTGFAIDGKPVGSYETAPYTVSQFDITKDHTSATLCDSASGLANSDDFGVTWLNAC
ncbi:MAG TPA: hypothetical protein VGS19_03500 [Streptosporangiaceae bacterium]|nr:hypothetical protein [Streptosporangiaceae bacterium]